MPPPLAADRPFGSYQDLQPGSTLTVVLPLLKSGGFVPVFRDQQVSGAIITLAANDVIGYDTFTYAVQGKHGPVRLKLVANRETKDGQTIQLRKSRPLPFALPKQSAYVRLLYLVRSSKADHNMAILASKSFDLLEKFTGRLNDNPAACVTNDEFFCSWIPAGVAVRAD